ncbi:hypothetical protein [Pseudoxanthomonas sp. 10H]|uniref:hypothetical protein n=1 Tax=Pseudoxanthomonas sp. 10H TaxID=3242729 RepID=UPI003556C127
MMRWLRVFLVACAVATVGVALWMARPWAGYASYDATGWQVLGAMLLWAVSPLAGMALAARLLRGSPLAWRVFAAGAAVIAIVGLVAYVDAAFVHIDAQGGLVFVFMPLWQWLATIGLGLVCGLVRLWKRPRPPTA